MTSERSPAETQKDDTIRYSAEFSGLEQTVSRLPERYSPDGYYKSNDRDGDSDSISVASARDWDDSIPPEYRNGTTEEIEGDVNSGTVKWGSNPTDRIERRSQGSQTTVMLDPGGEAGTKVTKETRTKTPTGHISSYIMRQLTHEGTGTKILAGISEHTTDKGPKPMYQRKYTINPDGNIAIEGSGTVKELTGKRAENFKRHVLRKTTEDLAEANTKAKQAVETIDEQDRQKAQLEAQREEESRLAHQRIQKRPTSPVWGLTSSGKPKSRGRMSVDRVLARLKKR